MGQRVVITTSPVSKHYIPSLGLIRDTVAVWQSLSRERWLIVQTTGIQCIF